MLRYRLSLTPNEGGEAKRRAASLGDREDTTDPFVLGGPLQEAIRGDLLRLFRPFVAMIRATASGNDGSAFIVFREFFKKHKIALLHHLAPPKSDIAAYSQLLYAVCFSIIRDTFMGQQMDTTFFERAAYGTFLLYTLYQTSPLPFPPKEDSHEGQLELLPFGLFDRRNPKENVFARHYRAPIRIDLEHYGYLVGLLDLIRVVMNRSNGTTPSSLLQDLLVVVQRIITSNMVEFCAYTGPCSLEGLAGHELYHFDGSRTSASAAESQAQSERGGQVSSICKDQLKRYKDHLKAIRLPALSAKMSNQSKRVRLSLEPVFSNTSPLDNMVKLANGEAFKTLKRRRHVSFGAVTIERLEDSPSSDENGVPEVTLPEGASTAQAESIRLAIRTLSGRGEDLLLPNKESVAGVSQGFGSSASVLSPSVSSGGSTLEGESDVGRKALSLLLEQTNHAHRGTNFLAAHPVRDMDGGFENPEGIIENLSDTFGSISDLSSDEEQDEVSIAVSRVGRSALQELLKAASGRKPRKRSAAGKCEKKKRQRLQTSGGAPHERWLTIDDTGTQQSKDPGTSGKSFDGNTKQSREMLINSTYAESSADRSTHTASDSSCRSAIGGNALRRLLEQAQGVRRRDDNQAARTDRVINSDDVVDVPVAMRPRPDQNDGSLQNNSLLSTEEESKLFSHEDNRSDASDVGRIALRKLLHRVQAKDKQS